MLPDIAALVSSFPNRLARATAEVQAAMAVRVHQMQAAGTPQADIDHMKKASGILQMISGTLRDISCCGVTGGMCGCATKAERELKAATVALQRAKQSAQSVQEQPPKEAKKGREEPRKDPSVTRGPGTPGRGPGTPGNVPGTPLPAPATPAPAKAHSMQGEVQARRVALEATVDLKKRPLDLSETRTLEELQELKKEHELHRRRQKERRREERRLQLQRRLEKRAKKGLAGRERGAGGAAGGASEGQRSGMTEHAGKSEIEELRETLLDELRKPRKRRVLEPDSRIDWTLFEGFQVYTQRDVGQRLGKLRRQKRQERAAKRAAQFAEESGAVPLTPPDFSMPDVDHADLWWELELPRQSARASLRGGPRRRPKRKSLGLGAGLGLGTSEDRAIRALQQLVQWRQSEDRAAADLAEAVEVDIEVIEVQPQPTRPGAPSEEAEAQAVASAGEPDSAIAEPEAKGTKAEASAPALAERTRRAREKYRVALEKFSKSERRNEIEWFLMQRIEPQARSIESGVQRTDCCALLPVLPFNTRPLRERAESAARGDMQATSVLRRGNIARYPGILGILTGAASTR